MPRMSRPGAPAEEAKPPGPAVQENSNWGHVRVREEENRSKKGLGFSWCLDALCPLLLVSATQGGGRREEEEEEEEFFNHYKNDRTEEEEEEEEEFFNHCL